MYDLQAQRFLPCRWWPRRRSRLIGNPHVPHGQELWDNLALVTSGSSSSVVLTLDLVFHLLFPDYSFVFGHSHGDKDIELGSDVGLLCLGKWEVEDLCLSQCKISCQVRRTQLAFTSALMT